MPTWSWWVIWSILIIGGAAYLSLIIFDLAAKAKRAIPVIEKSTKQIEELSKSLSKSVVLAEFQGNLLDEPGPLAAEYARNQKKRESKRLSEQRRLINKLIDYKADESEFHP